MEHLGWPAIRKNRGWIASLSESMRPIQTVLWVQAEFSHWHQWLETHNAMAAMVYTNKNRNWINHCRTDRIWWICFNFPQSDVVHTIKIITECQVFGKDGPQLQFCFKQLWCWRNPINPCPAAAQVASIIRYPKNPYFLKEPPSKPCNTQKPWNDPNLQVNSQMFIMFAGRINGGSPL